MASVADEERLALLLDELVEQSRDGRVPNFDAVLADVPRREREQVERELRSLWATAMIADDLAVVDRTLDQLERGEAGDTASPSGETATPSGETATPRGDTPATLGRLGGGGNPVDSLSVDLRTDGSIESVHGSASTLSSLAQDATLRDAAPHLRLPRQVGDYELREEIGRGGMGVVYRAIEIPLGRVVAVKMILASELATAEKLARFRREAEAAAKLRHPLIVPVYNVGELPDDHGRGQPFFSMMYVEGTTLAQRVASGPLPSREAAALLLRVCRAMADAHRQGVLHRDLKPSNILLDRTGRPYITDFGLAAPVRNAVTTLSDSLADGPTISGAILGTPSYMAPEQALGSRGVVGPAADVYALGGLLYAMLTGRPPFQSTSPLDTLLMVLEQDPPRPRLLNPKIDEDLEIIALKALQKPPDLRYESADTLADDLDAFLQGNAISARNYSLGQFLSRALRPTHHVDILQNWGLLWMWHALALLVLCLITVGFKWSGVQSRIPYLLLWTVGLGAWAAAFWQLRRRSGPVTFVERQIAHVWAGSMACVGMLYALEALLGLEVLKLSPVLGLIAGTVFLIKAGILSGEFYIQAAALYVTSLAMALWPEWGLVLFGVVSALCFFVPGLKFHRQNKRGLRDASEQHLAELRPLRG